jgi:molecular chaperone GrpE (heat shock protein)
MDSAQLPALKDRLAHLERESGQMAEAGLKLTAAETERQKALAELESKNQHVVFLNEQLEGLRNQLDDLTRKMGQKENDVAELRSTIDSLRDKSVDDPAVRVEIEQLTGQVADQLLAIQKLEDLLRRNQELLGAKDQELAILRQHQESGQSVGRPIPMGSDAEIIANFIDFFDGLDTYLVKNPIPELASLHKKLLERLIIPNEIQYLPVVSEEFNPENHIATDFFRSDRFPEKCIVFEVEKGYRKGNSIIKKSKVWVVQNLFPCPGCQAVQSNADSRFCHLCGQKIIAPNGLPVDSLPVFEPTPTTYLRFAERAVDRSDFAKAKEYLQEGLRIDPHYVPLLNRLADVCAVNSEFQEALDLLKRSIDLKADPAVQDKLHALEIKNTIFHQAQSLNLPPDEFEKLVSLIQK